MDTDYQQAAASAIIRRTGLIILLLGVAQLVLGLLNASGGNIRFDVMGMIWGLLIYFGNARVIAVLRWLAILGLAGWLIEPVKTFLLAPVDLTLAQVRLTPGAVVMAYLVPVLIPAAITVLTAMRLSWPEVKAAQVAAGRQPSTGRLPFALGLALTLVFSCFQYHVLNGEQAQHASQLAAGKLGSGYRYYTNSLWVFVGTSTTYSATVQAWNDREVLQVPVRWTRP
jgi:hypothetical protein